MKLKLSESIAIPEGIECRVENNTIICKKSGVELKKKIDVPGLIVSLENNAIVLKCDYGNKIQFNKIMTLIAHIHNLFTGLENKFIYKLQACNVHFPMTLKVEKNQLLINNFLGEKKSRFAKILPNVEIDVKGQNITLTSHDKESAGQTAANIEKATKVRNRDRRIFQDGIYIVERPGGSRHG